MSGTGFGVVSAPVLSLQGSPVKYWSRCSFLVLLALSLSARSAFPQLLFGNSDVPVVDCEGFRPVTVDEELQLYAGVPVRHPVLEMVWSRPAEVGTLSGGSVFIACERVEVIRSGEPSVWLRIIRPAGVFGWIEATPEDAEAWAPDL